MAVEPFLLLLLQDSSFNDIIQFLDAAEAHGRDILTKISTGVDDKNFDPRTHNGAYEARQLKNVFLALFDG